MAIISFNLTKKQFLAGEKTVTRRDWSDRQFIMWQRFWDRGHLVHDAYSATPIAGGKPIGKFRLTARPYREMLNDMPIEDLELEGGLWKSVGEYCGFIGKEPGDIMTVIRFKKL